MEYPSDASSVFLTPPSSSELKVPNKALSRINHLNEVDKPSFSLENINEKEENESKIDFISKLHEKSLVTTVCGKILENLTDAELVRASHVSKTWRLMVRYLDLKSGRRVSRYLRKRKKHFVINKENVLLSKKAFPAPEFRTPFSSVTGNILPEAEKNIECPPQSLFHTPVSSSTKENYKQCPACQSPAKTASGKTGHCKKCNHDFCLHCFYTKNKHSPTCQIVGGSGISGSPRKLPSTNQRRYSMGSKDNKSRLKRL